MKNNKFFLFWFTLVLSVVGEILLLFAAAYIAIAIYRGSNLMENFIMAIFVAAGTMFRLTSEVIRKGS